MGETISHRDQAPVLSRKSCPDVLVMKPSQDRNADNGAGSLDRCNGTGNFQDVLQGKFPD
jgi:hypothetical protein